MSMNTLPNCIVTYIFNLVCNDDLKCYNKLIRLNKLYKHMMKDIYITNMMYSNIKSNNTKMMELLKKNSSRLKYLCIDNLEYISTIIQDMNNLEKLIVTRDYNKSTFSYINKYKKLKHLTINMGIYDDHMPLISYPESLEELNIVGKIALNVKHNTEKMFENKKCKLILHKCGYNNNDTNNKNTKENKIFKELCEMMEEENNRWKMKKRKYETYEKHMNIEFFKEYYDIDNYEKNYDYEDYEDLGDYNLYQYN